MRVRSVQPTPNPNAFKFVLDAPVIERGVKNYTQASETAGNALARALFTIEGVDTLFFCEDFVTVSMLESADWRSVHDQVVKILGEHEGVAAPAAAAPAPAPAAGGPASGGAAGGNDQELLDRINELLDDRVRPALAGDGGGLEVVGLQGKRLAIRYQGACGSCPSSIAGTLAAIQNLIQTEIDDTVEVVTA